jgi:hypothetical protein
MNEKEISMQCLACENYDSCTEDKSIIINESQCDEFVCRFDYCEECFAKI